MKKDQSPAQTVDQYLAESDPQHTERLTEVRELIRGLLPDATERISYGMPGYYDGTRPLVYFAGQKGHLGFYPTPSAVEAFQSELTGYSTSKGCVRFPWDKPLPRELIRRMVIFKRGGDRR